MAEVLITCIEGDAVSSISLETELVIRESCGASRRGIFLNASSFLLLRIGPWITRRFADNGARHRTCRIAALYL